MMGGTRFAHKETREHVYYFRAFSYRYNKHGSTYELLEKIYGTDTNLVHASVNPIAECHLRLISSLLLL